jgi:predicted ArsR family transcriptional regulator
VKTSRQRLLAYIQAQQVVTVQDLSRALQMTPANARHHLAILAEQGLVETVSVRPTKGRGRPAKRYRLSERAAGHNLDRLSCALLDELSQMLPEEERVEGMKRIARRLTGEAPGKAVEAPDRAGRPVGLAQRFFQAIQRLNEMHYQARWEAHAEAPHVILGRCPYAAILDEHPELCQMDAQLLEILLELPARQTARQAVDSNGTVFCKFVVGRKKSGTPVTQPKERALPEENSPAG